MALATLSVLDRASKAKPRMDLPTCPMPWSAVLGHMTLGRLAAQYLKKIAAGCHRDRSGAAKTSAHHTRNSRLVTVSQSGYLMFLDVSVFCSQWQRPMEPCHQTQL